MGVIPWVVPVAVMPWLVPAVVWLPEMSPVLAPDAADSAVDVAADVAATGSSEVNSTAFPTHRQIYQLPPFISTSDRIRVIRESGTATRTAVMGQASTPEVNVTASADDNAAAVAPVAD